MFKSIKPLLTAVTVILAVSAPSVAYARSIKYSPPARSSTSGQAEPLIAPVPIGAQQRRLDQLRASEDQQFAAGRGLPTATSPIHTAGPSSHDGFQWDDAGIGAAVVLTLVGVGAGATLVIRRRTHPPLVS